MSREGVTINGKTISAAVGMVTLFLALVGGVTYVIRQDFRISTMETKVGQLEVSMKEADQRSMQNYEKILQKIDNLTAEITKLTISLNNIEYKQDLSPQKDK